jgi:hypothetical protein
MRETWKNLLCSIPIKIKGRQQGFFFFKRFRISYTPF